MPYGYRGGATQDAKDTDSNSGRKALLRPRAPAVEVVDVEVDCAEREQKQEGKLAELRRRALSALNLGLPPACDDIEDDEAEPSTAPSESHSPRCRCLKRSGRCTCSEDRVWLQSKRKEVSTYNPPHSRSAAGGKASSSRTEAPRKRAVAGTPAQAGEANEGTLCTCLKRSGRCTCKQDAGWLQRKRRTVIPYVPPYVKERDVDMQQRKVKQVEAEMEEGKTKPNPEATDAMSVASSLNMRWPPAEWDTRLEQRGDSRFNPLQMDGQIVLEDKDGLVAECVDHPLSVKGVKGLPAVQSGRYQYEVELLRDCSMMLGWSGAMTLPGVLDFQGYAFSSSGVKRHGQDESAYAKPFGKAGDIVGALIDWIEPETASGTSSVQISFCLNGESLGVAFEVAASLADTRKEGPIPLQPHICQLPKGDMLKVRLRGSKAGLPLAHPIEGYEPLSAVSDLDFCPFSSAVAAATSERVIMNLTADDLKSFRLPDSHVVELYDFPADTSGETLTSSVACFLGLKRYFGVLHVCITEAGSSTALVACRRPEHADRLIDATSQGDDDFGVAACIDSEKKRDKPLHFESRPLCSATARSEQRLLEWRGEAFKG